jgi:hypothetical protein
VTRGPRPSINRWCAPTSARRQAAEASNGTINRELAALERALTLPVQGEKIQRRPYVPMLVENNARQGSFEHEQLDAVLRHLPALRDRQ